MDDMYTNSSTQEPAPEQATRAMPPVDAAPRSSGRRRRTERNAASYEEAAAMASAAAANGGEVPPEMLAQLQQGSDAPAPTQQMPPVTADEPLPTQQVPAMPAAEETTAVPRFQTRYTPPVPGSIPSQGVPKPTSVSQPAPRRPVFSAGLGEVRRPVQAEGYVPVRPLGVSRADAQEPAPRKLSSHPERADVSQLPQSTRRTATLDDGEEYETDGKGHVLPIIIIVLLVIAALVLSLLLIPSDMEGPLGDVKRAVTGLFGGEKKDDAPVEALGFAGDVTVNAAPYQISLHVETTSGVQTVRIINSFGEVMPTTLITRTDNTNSVLHVLSMTLANEYEGYIYLQISSDGETWLDTENSLQLTIGTDMKLKISETSSTTLTAGSTAVATVNTTLAAGSTKEPTVSPAVTETDAPQGADDTSPLGLLIPDVPVAPDVEQPTETPTAEPVVTATPSPTPTATPTMAVTPTPTVRVTATPTAEPTATPTAEPTATPTAEPTATPVPTPVPTVKLEAVAGEGASPALITTQKIYKGTRSVDAYQRDGKALINMPAGTDYLTVDFGVTTFRGNAFRMNAASGRVDNPTAMTVAWTVPGGKLEMSGSWRYGFGVYSQPAIVKWTREVRNVMALNEGYVDKSALKEVIIAGQDGKVYFLDLATGEATRDAVSVGYALRGAPSVNTLGYPVITVGQWSNKKPSGSTVKSHGLHFYDLSTNERAHQINTYDDRNRAHSTVSAMDTSALFDRNSNTLIAIGTNGILYTLKLDMQLYVGSEGNRFVFGDVGEQASLVSYPKGQEAGDAAVESSLAMYGSYAFYADMGGVLRCVDTTTMTTIWAVETGDAVRASVALDLDEETGTLWLYTANTITNRSKNGNVTIRRYDAMTGEMSWELPVYCLRKYAGQKDATGKEITAGAVASPIIGQHGLGDLVYFTLSSVSADGYEALTGKAEKQPSVLIAINKADGSVVWTLAMDAYSYSSPVAVYNDAGEGWVLQCCSNGTIYLLNGLTGEVVNTLQVAGVIEGSPAVYNDMMVFGTTGKDKSFVYAIRLQ